MSSAFASYAPRNPAPDLGGAFGQQASDSFLISDYLNQDHREDAAQDTDQDTHNSESFDVMTMKPEELTPERRLIRIKTMLERYDIAGALDFALQTLSSGDLPAEIYEEIMDLVERGLSYLDVCGLNAQAQEFRYALAPYVGYDCAKNNKAGLNQPFQNEWIKEQDGSMAFNRHDDRFDNIYGPAKPGLGMAA